MTQSRKKVSPSDFEQYKQTLTEPQVQVLADFFADLNRHNTLKAGEKAEMQRDFERVLLYYKIQGVPLDEGLERLRVENLGGFYMRPPILWYPLDDAAKIYPLSMKHGKMSVFRLSVYLKQPVVPEILQMALTFTIKRFPVFATTVKKGAFWHYLDTAKRRYLVEPETDIPCRPLKIARSGSQSFRVLYFNNRISVEYFHILTDGTGGMVFLKTLTTQYLRLLGIEGEEEEVGTLNSNDLPKPSESANMFSSADKTENTSGFADKLAVQMSGRISKTKPCRVLHFKMDATQLKNVAKDKRATITAYLLALMFVAGRYATDEQGGSMNIQVPVNMRKYYPSDTLRNFAMYCGIRLPINDITDVESILFNITEQLGQKASKQSMSEMMNSTRKMVRIMQYIPLFLKAPAAKVAYGFLGDNIFSNTFSNLGVVTFSKDLEPHIESMDFVLGPSEVNRASCAMVTFGNTATFSITKMTADPTFEEKLYALLLSDGIHPNVEGSELHED